MKNVLFYAKTVLLAFAIIGMTSCSKDSEKDDTPEYKLSGTITNNTNTGVNNVSIELNAVSGNKATYTTTTNSEGAYEFSNVSAGKYTLNTIGEGYNKSTTDINIDKDDIKDFVIEGEANVNGTIINSQTGLGLANATINFSRPSTSKELFVEFIIITDNNGQFELIGAAMGSFTLTIEAEGFFTRIVEGILFSEGDNIIEQQTIVEEPEEGTYRIVLSWGESPSDLDSHITGPNGNDRFHVFYDNTIYNNGIVNLDVDDVSSYGPETITIKSFEDGMYRYSVHNYSNQNLGGGIEIQESPARVEIFDFEGLVSTFIAPEYTGEGNTWRVFEITASGNTIEINPINTYLQAQHDEDMDVFLNENGEKPVINYLMNEL